MIQTTFDNNVFVSSWKLSRLLLIFSGAKSPEKGNKGRRGECLSKQLNENPTIYIDQLSCAKGLAETYHKGLNYDVRYYATWSDGFSLDWYHRLATLIKWELASLFLCLALHSRVFYNSQQQQQLGKRKLLFKSWWLEPYVQIISLLPPSVHSAYQKTCMHNTKSGLAY